MGKRILSILLTLFITSKLNAGFHNFTMHSRANCGGFNESVSWEFNRSYWLLTNSVHIKPGANYSCNLWSHSAVTFTWRAAAYHWAEAYLKDNWIVYGTHYTSDNGGRSTRFMAKTYATDCNIYDGWWDV